MDSHTIPCPAHSMSALHLFPIQDPHLGHTPALSDEDLPLIWTSNEGIGKRRMSEPIGIVPDLGTPFLAWTIRPTAEARPQTSTSSTRRILCHHRDRGYDVVMVLRFTITTF